MTAEASVSVTVLLAVLTTAALTARAAPATRTVKRVVTGITLERTSLSVMVSVVPLTLIAVTVGAVVSVATVLLITARAANDARSLPATSWMMPVVSFAAVASV